MALKKQQIFVVLWLLIFKWNLQLIDGGVLFHFGFNFLVKDGNDDTSTENQSIEIRDLINETTTTAAAAMATTNPILNTNNNNDNNDNNDDNDDNDKLNTKENQANAQQNAENDKKMIMNQNIDDDEFGIEFITTVGTPTTMNSNSNTHVLILQKNFENYLKTTKDAIFNINNALSVVVGRSDIIANKVKLMLRYLNEVELEINKSVQIKKYTILRKFLILIDELQKPKNYGTNGERTMEYLLIKLLLEKYQVLHLKDDIEKTLLKAENEWKRYIKEKLINIAF